MARSPEAPQKICVICGTTFCKKPNVSRVRWEKQQCCSLPCGHALKRGRSNPRLGDAHRGRKQSPETIAARAASMKRAHAEGRAHAIDTAGLRKEKANRWKGDNVGYRAAHARIRHERGTDGACEFCRYSGVEWALRHEAENTKTETTGRFAGRRYSTNPLDYIFLCRPCHRWYDGRERDSKTGRYL